MKRDNLGQSRAFIKKARELEADEAKLRADDVIGRIAKMKTEPREKEGG